MKNKKKSILKLLKSQIFKQGTQKIIIFWDVALPDYTAYITFLYNTLCHISYQNSVDTSKFFGSESGNNNESLVRRLTRLFGRII
jgi:hypothetical protein